MEDLYLNTPVNELKYKDFKIKNKKLIIKHKDFKNKNGMIILYAPWCGHCQKIKDDVIELNLHYKNLFPIATINAENLKNEKLLKHLNYEYYPTIFTTNKKNMLSKYNELFDKNNIHYYIGTKL